MQKIELSVRDRYLAKRAGILYDRQYVPNSRPSQYESVEKTPSRVKKLLEYRRSNILYRKMRQFLIDSTNKSFLDAADIIKWMVDNKDCWNSHSAKRMMKFAQDEMDIEQLTDEQIKFKMIGDNL